MAPLLHRKILLTFLRNLHFARSYTKRFLGRLALLFTFLTSASGRKFSKWWHSRSGKPGAHRTTIKRADPPGPFLGTKANLYSVLSDGPAIVKQYTVAASIIPASASLPSLHERAERQPATAVDSDTRVGTPSPPTLANLPAEHSLHPLGEGDVNRSSRNLSAASIQSRASVRLSIITTSRDSLRATHGQPSRLPRGVHSRNDPVNRRSASMGSIPTRDSDRFSIITAPHDFVHATHDQSSRLPRGVYHQFGHGPDPSRSRERPTRPNTPHDPSRPSPEITMTNLPSLDHEDGSVSPVYPSPPSVYSPYAHRFTGPPSPPIFPLTTMPMVYQPPVRPGSEELYVPPEPSYLSTEVSEPARSFSAATSDSNLPDGRFVQLINSDQVPRYNKDASMQVEYTILSSHPYISFQTSRGDPLRFETFNNYIPLVSCI